MKLSNSAYWEQEATLLPGVMSISVASQVKLVKSMRFASRRTRQWMRLTN